MFEFGDPCEYDLYAVALDFPSVNSKDILRPQYLPLPRGLVTVVPLTGRGSRQSIHSCGLKISSNFNRRVCPTIRAFEWKIQGVNESVNCLEPIFCPRPLRNWAEYPSRPCRQEVRGRMMGCERNWELHSSCLAPWHPSHINHHYAERLCRCMSEWNNSLWLAICLTLTTNTLSHSACFAKYSV